MKWPTYLILIRHGQSAYNVLREAKAKDADYKRFLQLYKNNEIGPEIQELAQLIQERYALGNGDSNTELTEYGEIQALRTGMALKQHIKIPDVILYSPYFRTIQTLEGLCKGWDELASVPKFEDDRIREQEHGLSLLYNDKRVFHVFHPEQRKLMELQGDYWYQYPQGESVAMVRDRVRSMLTTITREFNGKRVLMVTHHLTILSIRATLERLTSKEFIRLDREEKPINCGVTSYKGDPNQGRDGKLLLDFYNQKLG